ncbi:MAG: CCA tRNA nucleotidyltransferase, partial [Clostridia bacterium]|nr:CCA tRNA nucleotidyltransferase [Clostridia bacterium]
MKLPTEVSNLLTRLESKGFEAFVVGGCVRDSLLNKKPADWDICTSAYPEDVQAIFPDHFVLPTGLKHGTVTVVSDGIHVEITTYRKDGIYLDSRHPESVTYTEEIKEDLKRRDFTINAMAYSPKKGLLDYFNGRNHLKKGVLCCVGDPVTRFSEDALRILRGLRFAAGYGLTIEPKTARAIHLCRDGLKSISAERILTELKKLLISP